MQHILRFVFLLLSSISLSQEINKSTLFNCVPIYNDILWMAKTEVSNLQFREFVSYVEQNRSKEEASKIFPDTAVWNRDWSNEKYAMYYFNHPAYQNYPVVGVSKEKAMAYCTWLTQRLNSYYQNDEKHEVLEVLVRLPTEKEWKSAAKAGDEHAIFGWEGNTPRSELKKFQGAIKGNYVRGKGGFLGVKGALYDAADVTAPVQSYWPNKYGLYNMSGNVSELLSDADKAIGGSWRTFLPAQEIDAQDKFREDAKPSATVGFRYVVEVVRFKDFNQKDKPLSAKMIEDMLAVVNPSFMIAKTEVSNELYNLFLKESNAKKENRSEWKLVSDVHAYLVNNYASHSYFANYPVVNITYEEAVAFCDWLTKKYNSFEKKKFSNLRFDLPTLEQWEVSARGNLKDAIYPWGGPYLRNTKGCFLANFHAVEERSAYFLDFELATAERVHTPYYHQKGLDGAQFTCAVDAYFPNGIGIHNMAGNVNEMIKGKQICKGGSWLSYSKFLHIQEQESYEGATPYTGFRFVATKP